MFATNESDPRIVITADEIGALLAFTRKDEKDPDSPPFVQFAIQGGQLIARADDGVSAIQATGAAENSPEGMWLVRRSALVDLKKLVHGGGDASLEFLRDGDKFTIAYGTSRDEEGHEVSNLNAPEGLPFELEQGELFTIPAIEMPVARGDAAPVYAIDAESFKRIALIQKAANTSVVHLVLPVLQSDRIGVETRGPTQWRALFASPAPEDHDDLASKAAPAPLPEGPVTLTPSERAEIPVRGPLSRKPRGKKGGRP